MWYNEENYEENYFNEIITVQMYFDLTFLAYLDMSKLVQAYFLRIEMSKINYDPCISIVLLIYPTLLLIDVYVTYH